MKRKSSGDGGREANVSLAEFARRVGVSRVYISKIAREGKLPLDESGMVKLPSAEEAWNALSHAAEPKASSPAPRPREGVRGESDYRSMASINRRLLKAKLAEKRYNAKLKELEYRRLRAELIHIDEVKADAFRAAIEIRQRLLVLPARLAGQLEGKTGAQISKIIEIAINDALTALNRTRFVETNESGVE